MPPILDAFPYPWHLPEARELHIVLCQLYRSGKAAGYAAENAGLNVGRLNTDQAPYDVWRDAIDLAAASKKMRTLVDLARQDNMDHPRRPFLDAVLAGQTPLLDSEPRGARGAPSFVDGTDVVTKPEALLFQDDLTLPIGRVPWLIGVLGKLTELAPSVCRLEVLGNGPRQCGTGFRIASDRLLTNWHVLRSGGAEPHTVTAEFLFDDDGQGGGTPSTGVPCNVTTIRGDAGDDWAVVAVAQALPDTIPILALSRADLPRIGESAFIVQHPGGERKRVAYVRNQVTSFTDRVIHYLSDTQGGSSGSPVLNDHGRLIGLHHAGGRPNEVAGKPPLSKNEGIRIEAVLKGLAGAGIEVP